MLWARWRWWCCFSAYLKKKASPKTFSATSSSCTGTHSQVRASHTLGLYVLLQSLLSLKKNCHLTLKCVSCHNFAHSPCTSVGKVLKHLSLSLFGSSFLGSQEHAGFLYVRSTLQSLQGLPLPNQPYLFGLLVHRAEVAWAKAFPLRLMLRLGAEYRCKPRLLMKVKCSIYKNPKFSPLVTCFLCFPVYPCPLYSVRFRKPLFGEIGHTIMRLLVVSVTVYSNLLLTKSHFPSLIGSVKCGAIT